MQTKQITCIRCPMGCLVDVDIVDGSVIGVHNNLCGRGKSYAEDEVLHPTRMVTSLIPVEGSVKPLSVKTTAPVPKDKVFAILQAIRRAQPPLPIAIGDVILPNVCNTGVDIVATCALGQGYDSVLASKNI